jgi:type I site-specific restriction-modification system R (restriction) subunit
MKRTLFDISDDLEKLNELLDAAGDDTQQQEVLIQWLEQLGEERDRKLDGYAALISEMQAQAEARKAEARRLSELAASDENRAQLLKDRLKWFFEQHKLKTLETARYRLSVAKNSTRPLIVNPDVALAQLPEEYKKVSFELNTVAIREALNSVVSQNLLRTTDRYRLHSLKQQFQRSLR